MLCNFAQTSKTKELIVGLRKEAETYIPASIRGAEVLSHIQYFSEKESTAVASLLKQTIKGKRKKNKKKHSEAKLL